MSFEISLDLDQLVFGGATMLRDPFTQLADEDHRHTLLLQ